MVMISRTLIALVLTAGLLLSSFCCQEQSREEDTALVEVADGDLDTDTAVQDTASEDASETEVTTDVAPDQGDTAADAVDVADTDIVGADVGTGPCAGATCEEDEYCFFWDYQCGEEAPSFAECWPTGLGMDRDSPGCGCDGVLYEPARDAGQAGINLQAVEACGPIPDGMVPCGPLYCDPTVEFCLTSRLEQERDLFECRRIDRYCLVEEAECTYFRDFYSCDCECRTEYVDGQRVFRVYCVGDCMP